MQQYNLHLLDIFSHCYVIYLYPFVDVLLPVGICPNISCGSYCVNFFSCAHNAYSYRHLSEVLKQVWELSDQDNDSMLSLKEWCTALYLMERFREGRPLPAALPSSIMFDETLLPTTQQQTPAYGNAAWRPPPGIIFSVASLLMFFLKLAWLAMLKRHDSRIVGVNFNHHS